LEGVDKDWVYAGTRHYASYTNLRGGNYIFRVKAANNDGIWNQQATTLRIHITPPFWQTFWFWGIIGLVIAGGAFGGYRLRVRDIEARNRELVKRVEQRTHELAALNTISSLVNRSLDLTEILKDALDHTLEAMQMDMGLAYRLEEPAGGPADEPSLSLLAHRGLSEDFLSAVQTLPLDESLIAAAAEAGKPIVQQADTHPRLQIANEREGIKLIISVPLLVKGKLVGGISLGAGQSRLITPEELSMLAAIGQQVGLAVENARLYEQAEQTAVATERNRLARELHDSVTQLLYSVTLYAEAMSELLASGKTETASGHLHKLRDTAQEALREMRLLIFELHQPALGPAGLAAALQSRLDAVETRGGVHAELQVEGSEELPPRVQAELYNIAQEALNNALKHAHANQVRIHLRFKEIKTEMEISDDGVGFDPTPDRMGGGYGITGMNERSRKIGGTIQIESSPGKGTKVIVSVPVNPQKEME
jgi:signal transduction histidine kinase